MTAGWVAGGVRGRLLLGRRLGEVGVAELAAAPSLEEAISLLSASSYGERLPGGADLRDAQRAVLETSLWHLRILAGWLPPRGVGLVRVLAAWFELATVEERLAALAGGVVPAAFRLGAFATVHGLESVRSGSELRDLLRSSAWGDPGQDGAAGILTGMRLSWARRVLENAPEAAVWVYGALALGIARAQFLSSERTTPRLVPGIPGGWEIARDVPELARLLPPRASWALAGATGPGDLWRAERAWWSRVESDARALTRRNAGRGVAVGVTVLLMTDAFRVAGALEVAARA